MTLRATRILLVEDASDVRQALEALLQAEGADVTSTACGRDALQCAERASFAVMLTDLGLPDIPGDVLIREILAMAYRRPRVVAMTGFGEPYVRQARAAGADEVLTKPLEWNDLLQALAPTDKPLAA